MARYLVLDWDHQRLQIIAGTAKNGAAVLEQAAAWQEAHSPNPALAEELGQQLRERLKQGGIAPAPVVVCVGRERVILKEIRHPPVAAADEPAVVRFQAFKELHDSPDEVILDYVPLDTADVTKERRALAVVLRRELLTTYQTLCKAAGLKLIGICPRPFGTPFAVRHAGAQETVAVLTATDRWAEFCVVRGPMLLLARTLAVPAGASDTLMAEIRRNLAVFAGQSLHDPVRALYVADGTEAGRLYERLQDQLAIPVHALDPLAGLSQPGDRRGAFAGAAGLLHALAGPGVLPINFSKPRDVPATGNAGKRRALLAGGLVAALVLFGLVLGYTELAARDRELADLALLKADLDRQLVLLKDDERRLKSIGDWAHTEVVWLDELYDLTDRFPEPKNLRMTQIATQPLTRTGTDKNVAQMTLKGITTDSFDAVDQFIAQLGSDGHYRVGAKEISKNTGVERTRFGQQFETRLDIAPRPPGQYTRRLPPPPKGAERPRDPEPVEVDPDAAPEGGQP